MINSRLWCGMSFGLLPSFTPFAFARARPSAVPVRISSRYGCRAFNSSGSRRDASEMISRQRVTA